MENSATSSTLRKAEAKGSGTIDFVKDLFATKSDGLVGQGVHSGIATLSRTVLRRLPTPLNYVAPMVVEKLIIRHGIPAGTDVLLKGLRWVKKVTDEKPASAL